jgi:hypothetical protein
MLNNKIIKAPFNYSLVIEGIDCLYCTLTKQQLVKNLKDDIGEGTNYSHILNGFKTLDDLEHYVNEIINELTDERPHFIRYSCVPCADEIKCDLVVIAKLNGGSCFIFTDNLKFLEMIIGEQKK